MLDNINENYLKEIIKEELKKYFNNTKKEEIVRKKISFSGEDSDLKKTLEKEFILEEKSDILVVSSLSLKNIFNLSMGIYENDYEKKIIEQLLENKKIILVEEGIEFLNYPNIPKILLEKYESYIKAIRTFGVSIQTKKEILKKLLSKEDIYTQKLLDLKKIIELKTNNIGSIRINEKTIVTSSALDYAKENNITIVKGR